MKRKKRSYLREKPLKLLRDYKIFAIASEGRDREPNYFRLFASASKRVVVDIIDYDESHNASGENNNSSPNWVLDRAANYIDREGLNEDDSLYLVIDIDRWSHEQLKRVADYCKVKPNWHLVLSNPCFEVWLMLHKFDNLENVSATTSKQFKKALAQTNKGGYNPKDFVPLINTAILNSKKNDLTKHFMPAKKTTKVYKLAEDLMRRISKSEFSLLCEKLEKSELLK